MKIQDIKKDWNYILKMLIQVTQDTIFFFVQQNQEQQVLQRVKQAQTDTINAIVKYCENPNHWNELKDCKLWGGKSDDLRVFLNGIFKEVEND